MPRPFNPDQQRQNRAFLAALRRTGNARAAARAIGMHRATLTKRRAGHPAFAAAWDAALALAHTALDARRNGEGDQAKPGGRGEHGSTRNHPAPHFHRTAQGRVQLRTGPRRRLTRAAEQAFLAALSATANVRLSAKAAGFSHSAFYQRRRQDAGFAREMRLALQMGYDRIELALLESTLASSHADDAWRHNDPPPIPAMTATQALQLLYLHQKEARLLAEPAHIKRRRGESADARQFRLAAMYREGQRRDREAFDLAEAARRDRGEPPLFGPQEPPSLPALDQVTGWSKADPTKLPTDAGRALFGGWRLGDWEAK